MIQVEVWLSLQITFVLDAAQCTRDLQIQRVGGLGHRRNVSSPFLSPVIMVFCLSFSIFLSNIRMSCVTGVIARVRTWESLVATY